MPHSEETKRLYLDGNDSYKHPELRKILEECYFASYSYDGSHTLAGLYKLESTFRRSASFIKALADEISSSLTPDME